MGKILDALKQTTLDPATEAKIRALDDQYTRLEQFVKDQHAAAEEQGLLKEPAPRKPTSPPYDPEQGIGKPIQHRAITRRRGGR